MDKVKPHRLTRLLSLRWLWTDAGGVDAALGKHGALVRGEPDPDRYCRQHCHGQAYPQQEASPLHNSW